MPTLPVLLAVVAGFGVIADFADVEARGVMGEGPERDGPALLGFAEFARGPACGRLALLPPPPV